MCVVSNVSDQFIRFPPKDWTNTWPPEPAINLDKVEIALLRKEIERLKDELEKARAQDIKDNNPDCHMEDKVNIILGLAKALGVDLTKVFEGHK